MIGSFPLPTVSNSHIQGSGFHGSPVEANKRSEDRSCWRTGSSPCSIRERISVGETPRML